jgi:hypothetical protein
MRAVQARDGPKIEVGQFLQYWQACGLDALALPQHITLRQFLLHQQQQEAVVAQIGARGLVRHLGILFRKDRQMQLLEIAREEWEWFHAFLLVRVAHTGPG